MFTDVTMKFSISHEKVTDCVRSHVHLRKLSRKQLSIQFKLWISARIKHMIAKRDKYLRRFNKTHSVDMEYLYQKFRNKVVTEIREIKNDYYADYFTKHKTMQHENVMVRHLIYCQFKIKCRIKYF